MPLAQEVQLPWLKAQLSSGWRDLPPSCPAALIGVAKEGSRLAFSSEYPHQENLWHYDFPVPTRMCPPDLNIQTEGYSQLENATY